MDLIPCFVEQCEAIIRGSRDDQHRAWFELGLAKAVDVLHALEAEGAPESKRDSLEHLLLAWVLGNDGLDARASVAWRNVGIKDLGLSEVGDLEPIEKKVAKAVLLLQGHEKGKRRGLTARQALRIAGITLVGGGIMAAGGAIAAPIIGTALASTTSAATVGAFLASMKGIGVVAGVFGAYGANRTAWKMVKREGGLGEFFWLPAVSLPSIKNKETTTGEAGSVEEAKDENEADQKLHCVLGISGWLLNEDTKELCVNWSTALAPMGGSNKFALVFDRKILLEYGTALRRFVYDQGIQSALLHAAVFAAGHTVALAAAPPSMAMLLQDVVDSPFAVAKNRAKSAGAELARAISSRAFGHRPVSLVGFGFGATAIIECLENLAAMKDSKDARGYIQDVVLFAAPIRISPERWTRAASCVAGRFVNHYCRNDLVLVVLLRLSTKTFPAAGVAPIEDVPGLVNKEIKSTSFQIGTKPELIAQYLKEALVESTPLAPSSSNGDSFPTPADSSESDGDKEGKSL